jgi:hypothetical protein
MWSGMQLIEITATGHQHPSDAGCAGEFTPCSEGRAQHWGPSASSTTLPYLTWTTGTVGFG